MKVLIEVADLQLIVAQIRSGMIVKEVTAEQLAHLIARAPRGVSLELVEQMRIEIEMFGHCRQKVHDAKQCNCRRCEILKELKDMKP